MVRIELSQSLEMCSAAAARQHRHLGQRPQHPQQRTDWFTQRPCCTSQRGGGGCAGRLAASSAADTPLYTSATSGLGLWPRAGCASAAGSAAGAGAGADGDAGSGAGVGAGASGAGPHAGLAASGDAGSAAGSSAGAASSRLRLAGRAAPGTTGSGGGTSSQRCSGAAAGSGGWAGGGAGLLSPVPDPRRLPPRLALWLRLPLWLRRPPPSLMAWVRSGRARRSAGGRAWAARPSAAEGCMTWRRLEILRARGLRAMQVTLREEKGQAMGGSVGQTVARGVDHRSRPLLATHRRLSPKAQP